MIDDSRFPWTFEHCLQSVHEIRIETAGAAILVNQSHWTLEPLEWSYEVPGFVLSSLQSRLVHEINPCNTSSHSSFSNIQHVPLMYCFDRHAES